MNAVARIIDTSAIQRYVAANSFAVSAMLLTMADVGMDVMAPATCISEAYWAVAHDDGPMLDLFHTLPQVTISPLESSDAMMVGGIARFMGSLGIAHAALLARSLDVPLLTAEPVLASKFLPSDLIWEV